MLRCRFRRVSRGSRVAAVRNHCEQRRNATRFGFRAILHHIAGRSVIRFQVIGLPLARLSRTGPSRSALVQICERQVVHVSGMPALGAISRGCVAEAARSGTMMLVAGGPADRGAIQRVGRTRCVATPDGKQQNSGASQKYRRVKYIDVGPKHCGHKVDREEVSTGTGGIGRAGRVRDGLPSRIRLPRRRASHQELPTAAVKLVGACHEGSSGHLPRDQELPTLLHCKILQLRVDDVSTHVSENEKFRLAAP
jgi:hypothetical protein